MTPYYRADGITIYCADARSVLPWLDPVDVIVTDPVWPDASVPLFGSEDSLGMFRQVAEHFPRIARRVVVHLGCNSDPRFLTAIPESMAYFRTCWLRYIRPGYKGRILYTSDVAYVFGVPPPSKPGAHVIPGETVLVDSARERINHPCPRQLGHVRWLCRWFANGPICDPMMGSGTTLVAARQCGWPAVGIEVCEEHCAEAVGRLRQGVMDLAPSLAPAAAEQSPLWSEEQ